jgi:MFS family permease
MASYYDKNGVASADAAADAVLIEPIEPRKGLSAKWGVIACGAGLFADGYLNAVCNCAGCHAIADADMRIQMIGFVKTMLGQIYGPEFKKSVYLKTLLSPMTFAGTVLGMLVFGFTSDHWSRKGSLLVSTVIIVVFAILQTASYGAGGTTENMILALIVYRFFLGIGIGGEYPAGSVGAAEHTASLKEGTRNRWFIWFSNVAIDMGFVLAPLVALIVVCPTPSISRSEADPP